MVVIFVLVSLCACASSDRTNHDQVDKFEQILAVVKELQNEVGILKERVLHREATIRANNDKLRILGDLVERQEQRIRANEKLLKRIVDHVEVIEELIIGGNKTRLEDYMGENMTKHNNMPDITTDERDIDTIFNAVTTTTPAPLTTSKTTTTTTSSTTTSTTSLPVPPTLRGPGTKQIPGKSCKLLKENNPALKNGLYWIKVYKPIEMYCDMETHDGGWTLVARATVATEAEATEVHWKKILSSDTSRLAEVTKSRFLLDSWGLDQLEKHIKFSHIRWFCRKQYHNRTLNIRTADNQLGRSVVDYMIGRISRDDRPVSCGSFTRLHDDSSVIGQHCERWGHGKWFGCYGDGRLYCIPMYITEHFFHLGDKSAYVRCDDIGDEDDFSALGEWMVYVK